MNPTDIGVRLKWARLRSKAPLGRVIGSKERMISIGKLDIRGCLQCNATYRLMTTAKMLRLHFKKSLSRFA